MQKYIMNPVTGILDETKDIKPIPEIKTELNLPKTSNEKKKFLLINLHTSLTQLRVLIM